MTACTKIPRITHNARYGGYFIYLPETVTTFENLL